jgi:hypothetical protein
MLLSQYQTAVRRILNDAQRNYWADPELTDYINEARRQVAVETICVRKFQVTALITGQEQYNYSDILPTTPQTVDIVNATCIWGNSRVPLGYMPFSLFSATFRTWTNYQRVPAAFSIYNSTQFWIGYTPDQAYPIELDTAVLPANLANDNTIDTIPPPYDEAVKFFAASLARLKLQQYTEYKALQSMYTEKVTKLGCMSPRRIPYVFENEVF